MSDAASCGHQVHGAGLDFLDVALAVAVHDAAVEQIGHGGKPDMRMRPHVHALAGHELHRAEMIEEDEGADHLPLAMGQGAAHGESVAEIAGARHDDEVQRIAGLRVAEDRIVRGHPAHCASPGCGVVAGTAVLQNGVVSAAVAADIRENPLSKAEEFFKKLEILDKVDLKLTDGLDGIDLTSADVIVIAGMGGETISAILASAGAGRLGGKLLILQPMTKLVELKEWIFENGYRILDEKLVKDDGRIYNVLSSSVGKGTAPTPGSLYAGEHLFEAADRNLREYLDQTIKKLCTAVRGIEQSGREEDQKKLAFYKAALVELKEARGR